jgi:hypothetical protein
MTDPNDDTDLATAQRGIEVEKFLAGPVGTYLIERAMEEIDAARLELDEVDAEDAHAVRTLQNRIKVAKHIGVWMREVIEDGYAAERRIRGEDDEAPY